MKSKLKKHILKMLSENLSMFYPKYKNSFMCPTCFQVIPIADLGKISEAHVIPKKAGGKLKTFLCKNCNNKFGSKQDKWFGDIINIANNPNLSIFSSAIKDGYFEIDGIKVNGTWKQEKDGNFAFYIHIDRNSPETNELINKKFGNKPPKIQLAVPMPILRNQRLISVGFLTAAYLMWFGLLGYSWPLQTHLDMIRKQIIEPEKEILEPKFLLTVKSANWKPWIGLVTLFGDTVPAFGLKRHLVVFPPRDRPNYYDSLKKSETDINYSDIKPLKLPDKPFYGPPLNILFENRLIVFATPSKEAEKHVHTILYTNDSTEGKILRPIGKEKFEKLKKMKNAKYVNIKVPDA
jgi:hypothetical protein